ncbi:Cpr, partial [Symbiodinium sp. CCMP2592]
DTCAACANEKQSKQLFVPKAEWDEPSEIQLLFSEPLQWDDDAPDPKAAVAIDASVSLGALGLTPEQQELVKSR